MATSSEASGNHFVPRLPPELLTSEGSQQLHQHGSATNPTPFTASHGHHSPSSSQSSSGDDVILTPPPSLPSGSSMDEPLTPSRPPLLLSQSSGVTDDYVVLDQHEFTEPLGSQHSNTSDPNLDSFGDLSRISSGTSSANQSTQALSTPPSAPCNPPTAQDWANYREIFTKIYRDQGRPLKVAKDSMARRYNFHASERMFKRRIKEWGLRKYSRKGKTRAEATRSPSQEEHVRTRPDQSRRSSSQESSGQSSPSIQTTQRQIAAVPKTGGLDEVLDLYMRAAHPADYKRFINLSSDYKNVQIILTQIDNYYQSYSRDMWERNFPKTARGSIKEIPLALNVQLVKKGADTPTVVHPGDLFNRFHMAAELLKMKDEQANRIAWQLLDQAFALIRDVVRQQHPQLMRYYFMQFWDSTYDAHPQVRALLFNHMQTFATWLYGPHHPIAQVTALLPLVQNPAQVCELAWRRNLDTFDEVLGDSHDENLRSKMAVTGNYIDSKRYDEAVKLLNHVIKCYPEDSTAYYKRAALCRVAWIHTLQHEYKEAEPIFIDVLERCERWAATQLDTSAVDDVYLAVITHLSRLQARRSYSQGEAMLRDALVRVTAYFGPDHAYAYTIKTELENLKEVANATDLLEGFNVGL